MTIYRKLDTDEGHFVYINVNTGEAVPDGYETLPQLTEELLNRLTEANTQLTAGQAQANTKFLSLRQNVTDIFRDAIESGNGLDSEELLEYAEELGLDVQTTTTVEVRASVTVTIDVEHVGELDLDDIDVDFNSYDGTVDASGTGDLDVRVTDVSFYIESKEA